MSLNYTPIDDLIQAYKEAPLLHETKDIEPSKTQAPSQPISLPKEAGPAIITNNEIPEDIDIEHRVETDKLEEALQNYVQMKPQNIKIPDELKKHGLTPIEKTKYADYQNIKLPLSDDKIALGLHAPITSSLRWLATFALFLLQQSHLTLKVIHGRVVRVVKTS